MENKQRRLKQGTLGWMVGLWFLLVGSNLSAQTLPLDSVYVVRTGREVGLLALGGALNGGAYLIGKGVVPLTPIQIEELGTGGINAFDRGATRNWSPTAQRFSDLTLLGTAGIVGLTGLPTLRQKKWFTVPLLYAETMLLTLGVQDLVKVTTLRTRPFVYNAQAPLAEKIDPDARRAFFSGHAALSFSSAVFASTVFARYFPGSKLKPVVWTGSLALAATTAVLRYTGGKHYPTDLLVGAAVGSAIGWLVPKLHEPKKRPNRTAQQWQVTPWSNGPANGVSMRLTL